MRVAIYARVSKDDDSQTTDNQLLALRTWCAESGHTIVGEYIDHVSGTKRAENRPRFRALLAAFQPRETRLLETAPHDLCDMVLVWSLDRWSREGMVATVTYLKQLADCGVLFRSHIEPAVSSDNEMIRNIVIAVMSELAKSERLRISERTKAGLARVRVTGSKSGRAIGRPAVDPLIRARMAELHAANPHKSMAWIGRQVGLDRTTARKYLTG